MTPQTQLIKTETFKDIPVRIVDHNGVNRIPVVDIVNALDYDRSNITRLMKRNEELFSPYKGVVRMTTPGGDQDLVCLSETGIVGLLIKMDYTRVKDKGFRQKVLDFQKWSFKALAKANRGELVEREVSPLTTIKEQLDLADIAIERSDIPKEVAHKMAWALVGNRTGNELATSISGYLKAQTKQLSLPEAIPKEVAEYESHYSITKVASFLKLPVDKVRNVLESLGVIYFENGIWHLTKKGEQYGKMFMVTPGYPYSSHQKAYIKYNPKALELLKKYFDVDIPITKVPE